MEVERGDTAFMRPETPRLNRAASQDPGQLRRDALFGIQQDAPRAGKATAAGGLELAAENSGGSWTTNPVALGQAESTQREPLGAQTSAGPLAGKPPKLLEALNNPSDILESTDKRPSVAVDPGLSFKLYLIFGLVLADILVDAFTEPVRIGDTIVHILTFSFQFFIRLATIMAFCLLTADILFIRMNFYDKYFYEFRIVFFAFFVSSVTFFSVRGYGLFLVYEQFPPMAVWTMNKFLYVYLYGIARFGNLVYYCVLMISAQLACSERLYDRTCLRS